MNRYAIENEKGHPGMKDDTAVDFCDSFASEGGINPGEAVIRGTDPAGQVKTVAATDDRNAGTLRRGEKHFPGSSTCLNSFESVASAESSAQVPKSFLPDVFLCYNRKKFCRGEKFYAKYHHCPGW